MQNLLLRRYGGCGVIPSGTYHAELPSTALNPGGGIDGHALSLLSEQLRASGGGPLRPARAASSTGLKVQKKAQCPGEALRHRASR